MKGVLWGDAGSKSSERERSVKWPLSCEAEKQPEPQARSPGTGNEAFHRLRVRISGEG